MKKAEMTIDLIKSIVRLRSENAFINFEKWLENQKEDVLSELINQQDKDNILRAQGDCRRIDFILKTIKESREILDNVTKSKNQVTGG